MKERPILFSGPMVRAILAGQKTKTRRVAYVSTSVAEQAPHLNCKHGVPGDRLWVRETAFVAPPNFGDDDLRTVIDSEGRGRVVGYIASMDDERCARDYGVKCTPSIYMPRWASRITLEIAAVRLERLHDITDADITAEGVTLDLAFEMTGKRPSTLRWAWAEIWDSINGKRPGCDWLTNPWVWALSFVRCDRIAS